MEVEGRSKELTGAPFSLARTLQKVTLGTFGLEASDSEVHGAFNIDDAYACLPHFPFGNIPFRSSFAARLLVVQWPSVDAKARLSTRACQGWGR